MLSVERIKGKNKSETLENLSLLGVILGAVVFSAGVGLTVVSTEGVSVVITMMGAMLSFISSMLVVGILFVREVLGKE